MTVASEAFFTDWFLADGVTKDWPYDFGIISSTHVRVLVRDGTDDTTVVEYNSGFSFFPAADYGSGVVRYPATGSALAAGKQVRILRQMDFLQSTEIGMEGSFAPILHERAFDKLTMQTQQLKEDAKRSMKAPLGVTGYEFSSGFLDYQTFMKLGNLIVPGPTAAQIENAEANAEDAIAAKVAAEAARDLAAGYASSVNPANFYTKGQIDGFRTTDQNAAKDAGNLTTGTVPDARLPVRLQSGSSLSLADQPEAEAGAENTKAMTALRTKQQIDARFMSYLSSPIAITAGGTFSLTHGLGQKPKYVTMYAKCLTADLGYSVGDEVEIPNGGIQVGGGIAYGVQLVTGATMITGKFAGTTGPIVVLNKSTGGGPSSLTAAYWALYVRAFA